MKSSVLLSVAVLASVFSLGASAEQYQGVLQFQSTATRADVRAQAVVAAHSEDPYSEAAQAGVPPVFQSQVARSDARSQAVAAARAGNLYGDVSGDGVARVVAGNVDRQAVRAEARATAARGISEGS